MPTPELHGGSYQLNPTSPNDSESAPATAALDDGRFATVYRSDDTMDGTLHLVIHNMDGTVAVQHSIIASQDVNFSDSKMVDIAALDGGRFVVTWVESTSAGDDVYHRVYDASGEALSGKIHTNADSLAGTARRPDVAGDGQGGFYVVWDDFGYDTDPGPGQIFTRSVRMRHFGADGQPAGNSEMLSDSMGGDFNASIAVNRDGSLVNVIWDDNLGQMSNHSDGIYGKVIGGDGFYRADSGDYSEFHTDPDVAYSTGNTFMAVWNEYTDTGDYAVYGSISGGPEFQINTSAHTHSTTLQKVVGLRDGNFLVVWNDNGFDGNDDVLGQLISSTGEKIGSEFTISDRTATYISRISASETVDGRVIVTWSTPDGDSDVYGRVVDPRQGTVNLTGDESDEQFTGTSFADTIDGGDGDDVLQGMDGADMLTGGAGNDTASYHLSGSGVRASLSDPAGNLGHAAGDSYVSIENLKGSRYDDTLIGDSNANGLSGLEGNDLLQGGGGNDDLQGGDGNDVLSGEAGADVMTGGAGADTFLFGTPGDSTARGDRDLILDFARRQDRIDLRQLDADADTRGNQAFEFIGKQKFGRDEGELRYQFRNGDTVIEADIDGNGKADFSFVLEGEIKMTEGLFLL